MHRRAFLRSAGVAGVVGAAGCVGSGADADASGGDSDPSTSSETPTPEPPVSIIDQELIHEGEGEDTQVRVEATARNDSDQDLGQVVATATFVEGDTLLGSWVVTANGVAPGQRWMFSIRSGGTSGEDARAVDDVRLEVEERTPPTELRSDRVEIVEDELVRGDRRPAVEGLAENAGEERLEYMEIAAMFTDEDGMLLGQALVDTVRDVDPGQQFQFSVGYSSPVRPEEDVAGYQLTTEAHVEQSDG